MALRGVARRFGDAIRSGEPPTEPAAEPASGEDGITISGPADGDAGRTVNTGGGAAAVAVGEAGELSVRMSAAAALGWSGGGGAGRFGFITPITGGEAAPASLLGAVTGAARGDATALFGLGGSCGGGDSAPAAAFKSLTVLDRGGGPRRLLADGGGPFGVDKTTGDAGVGAGEPPFAGGGGALPVAVRATEAFEDWGDALVVVVGGAGAGAGAGAGEAVAADGLGAEATVVVGTAPSVRVAARAVLLEATTAGEGALPFDVGSGLAAVSLTSACFGVVGAANNFSLAAASAAASLAVGDEFTGFAVTI